MPAAVLPLYLGTGSACSGSAAALRCCVWGNRITEHHKTARADSWATPQSSFPFLPRHCQGLKPCFVSAQIQYTPAWWRCPESTEQRGQTDQTKRLGRGIGLRAPFLLHPWGRGLPRGGCRRWTNGAHSCGCLQGGSCLPQRLCLGEHLDP